MEAVNRAQAETGEIKGHYCNVTAATMEDMYERAECAADLGSVIMDLKLQETNYQVALAATAKVLQPTLMDFLR